MAQLNWGGGSAALAVSGGGDSLAMMLLFADWAREKGRDAPVVLSVDHGLREGSAKDSRQVVAWAKKAKLRAFVLRWRGRKPKANIEDEARAARYALMGAWCAAHKTGALFLAHTEDDQAETFLLRLARGSGVDGLSAMRPKSAFPAPGFAGVEVLRPLLCFNRTELRQFLEHRGVRWLEDPMNAEMRFTRVRMRTALKGLEAAGVTASRIAQAAGHIQRAREALEAETDKFFKHHARFEGNLAFFDAGALKHLSREIGLRALAAILMAVSGEAYRPRFERLTRLFEAVVAEDFNKARTLHSCRVGRAPKGGQVFGPSTLIVAREGKRRGTTGGSSNSPRKGRIIDL